MIGMYEELIRKYTSHFGIPEPNVRVGCSGCPHYVGGECRLGFVACYDPRTKTITFSNEVWLKEEVILHELLHYVVDMSRYGYEVRVGITWSSGKPKVLVGLGLLLMSIIK